METLTFFKPQLNNPSKAERKRHKIHRRWDGFPTAKVFKQHTVLQCNIGIIGVNGIQDALIANLALGSETNEAANERIRRVGPSPPPHAVGIENLESPITLPSPRPLVSPPFLSLSLFSTLFSFSSSSSCFFFFFLCSATKQTCAQYNAHSCACRNYKLFSICTAVVIYYCLLFFATFFFCCCRRVFT